MVRKRGSGYSHLFLHLSYDHPFWMRGQQQAQDLQTRFRPQRGKPQSATADQSRVWFPHVSIIAELWKKSTAPSHPFSPWNAPPSPRILLLGSSALETAPICFDRVWVAWDTFRF